MTGLDLPIGRASGSIRMIELGDELSVFNAATGVAVALNRTAADVVALADGRATIGEVIGTLARAYGVPPRDIEPGIRAVIDQLTEAGILVPAP
jgi:hypothetical protein